MDTKDTQTRETLAGQRRTAGVESPRRVLEILLQYSEQRPRATVQDIAADISVPISTAYRYVALLKELGLLEETPGNTYRVGPRILTVARAVTAASGLATVALPIMRRLVSDFDETVMLVRMIADSAVCVAKVECSHPVRLTVQPGQALPLYRGASGKTLLAFLPKRHQERLLELGSQSDPELSTRIDELRVELGNIAAAGWTVSSGEIDPGIWACSAAVMYQDTAVATLSTAGPSHRVEPRHSIVADQIRAAAAELAHTIEYYDSTYL